MVVVEELASVVGGRREKPPMQRKRRSIGRYSLGVLVGFGELRAVPVLVW